MKVWNEMLLLIPSPRHERNRKQETPSPPCIPSSVKVRCHCPQHCEMQAPVPQGHPVQGRGSSSSSSSSSSSDRLAPPERNC
jgi:hypothetical protein